MITNDNKNGENDAEEVIKEGKSLAPLFDFAAQNPIAMGPKSAITKAAPDPYSLPLKNARHEKFCQLCAYGSDTGKAYSFWEAYTLAFYKEGQPAMTRASARANASRLRRDHPEIDKRIAFLDRELKEETMLHRGSTFARTINQVSGVVEAMSRQKSNPKAASVLVSAAALILKATGNEAPPTKTEIEAQVIQSDGLGAVRAGLMKVMKKEGVA